MVRGSYVAAHYPADSWRGGVGRYAAAGLYVADRRGGDGRALVSRVVAPYRRCFAAAGGAALAGQGPALWMGTTAVGYVVIGVMVLAGWLHCLGARSRSQGRGLSMAVVEAPGPVVLQQAAMIAYLHFLGNPSLGRQRVRDSVPVARDGRILGLALPAVMAAARSMPGRYACADCSTPRPLIAVAPS